MSTVTMTSKRHGGDARGSSISRRARKIKMIKVYGNGCTVECVWCSIALDFASLTIDRIIPGSEGGSYRWDNVQPACLHCNQERGDKSITEYAS